MIFLVDANDEVGTNTERSVANADAIKTQSWFPQKKQVQSRCTYP
ncbi:MAG: hypothetical protein ABIX01_23490 [Chitinophagaceae bacterium]